jgi:hypothetical protein
MSGHRNWNAPAFLRVHASLLEQGIQVANPAALDHPEEVEECLHGFETPDSWQIPKEQWETYLKRDLRIVLACDAVARLRGWQNSVGARLEVYVAEQVGIFAGSPEEVLDYLGAPLGVAND